MSSYITMSQAHSYQRSDYRYTHKALYPIIVIWASGFVQNIYHPLSQFVRLTGDERRVIGATAWAEYAPPFANTSNPQCFVVFEEALKQNWKTNNKFES